MPQVKIDGGPTVEVAEGTKLVLAIEDAGVDILHRCGGNCRCTTCRVEVLEGDAGPMEEMERERLAREQDLAPGVRLSCQCRVGSDLTVRVLRTAASTGMAAGPRPAD
jgi:ferredoxin